MYFGLFFIVVGSVMVGTGSVILFFLYFYRRTKVKNYDVIGYDPNMTEAAAQWKIPAAQARGQLLAHHAVEREQLGRVIQADSANKQHILDQEILPYRHQLQQELEAAQHDAMLAHTENQREIARRATELGVDPQTMHQLILDRARVETEKIVKEHELELEVRKHRQLKQVDFEFEQMMAVLDTKMADIANLLPQHQLAVLHDQLSKINYEFVQVKALPEGEFRDMEMERVKQKMKTWEDVIRERTEGLS